MIKTTACVMSVNAFGQIKMLQWFYAETTTLFSERRRYNELDWIIAQKVIISTQCWKLLNDVSYRNQFRFANIDKKKKVGTKESRTILFYSNLPIFKMIKTYTIPKNMKFVHSLNNWPTYNSYYYCFINYRQTIEL